jgi:hypothetical protein
MLRPTVSRSVGQSVLVSSTYLGPKTRFLLLSDSCGFVDVGRPLWRENGSIIYNCFRFSSAQSYFPPMKTISHFTSWILIILLWLPLFCLLQALLQWAVSWSVVNMSRRDELFALGTWTDWLCICWLCLEGEGSHFSHCGGAGLHNWGCCCYCALLRGAAAKGSAGVVWLGE